MKKNYFFFSLLFVMLCGWTTALRSEVKLTVDKQYGETVNFWITPVALSDDNVQVDWGDGVMQNYTIDPAKSDYYKKVSGTYKGVEGDTVRIYCEMVILECSEQGVTSVAVVDEPAMTQLRANKNKLTHYNCLLDGAPNLEFLDMSNNQLNLFDVRSLKKLRFFTASSNPQLTTVMFSPEGENGEAPLPFESIEQITLNDCDISHFYPVSMPNLTSLSIANGSLADLEIGENYPKLSSLDVSGNYISSLDVTKCAKLGNLSVSGNQLAKIDVSQNTELTGLYCSNNQIETLDLNNNKSLSRLGCDNNKLTVLDVTALPNLTSLACDSNKIKVLDLSHNNYLKTIYCKANELEFLDFSGKSGMDYIDCRGNAKMTACALNYMFSTILSRYRDPWSPNLLVDGCQWETADMSEISNSDMKWQTDVQGDGTADCGEVSITLLPSQNGTFFLEQAVDFGQKYQQITDKAVVGAPIRVVAEPDEDFAFASVVVNGEVKESPVFVVNGDATIAVNFVSTEVPYITLNVAGAGQDLQISLAAAEDDTRITVDWGNGIEETETINKAPRYIDGISAGTVVKISGEVTYMNVESLPPFGHDNQITGLDVSHNDRLVHIEAYMSDIKTLSVDNCPNLEYLDCAYCGLSTLDVSKNTKLVNLICYGNELEELNVDGLTELVELNARNNKLTTVNVSANTKLQSLNLHDNRLASLDVTALADLLELAVGLNQLNEIDVTKNTELWSLAVEGNQLTALDLSHNPQLARLLCQNNRIAELDLSAQEVMYYIECSNNGMTACAVNDFYFSLPRYEKPESDKTSYGETFSLWIQRDGDATPNDAAHAAHLMATAKGWTVNQEGDGGSGCDDVYVVVREPENGTIALRSGDNELATNGAKVAKGVTVNVIATPAEGYALTSLKANGVNIMEPASFVADRFTEVVALFGINSGVEAAENSNVMLVNEKGGILVISNADIEVEVFSANGVLLKKQKVSGREKIALSAGAYVFRLKSDSSVVAETVMVN